MQSSGDVMELSEDSVVPQALTMTILASVLVFYWCSCDLMIYSLKET